SVADRQLDLDLLDGLDEGEVVEQLCALRGVGPWTAHMFCIFELGYPDVWPISDYGVRKGYAIAHEMAEPPEPRELEALGEPYRPYRSAAAWYFWRAVEG
ncbi:MAG: DNA-3-methyladenine glycosylase family protein, partial [Thermoplasmata archaeon]